MAFDIAPDAIQQLIDEKFADLHVRLERARSVEEKEHLVADVEQYVYGLRDFFSCAAPTAMPAHAQAEGDVDVDAMIKTILDTALHLVRQLGVQVQEP